MADKKFLRAFSASKNSAPPVTPPKKTQLCPHTSPCPWHPTSSHPHNPCPRPRPCTPPPTPSSQVSAINVTDAILAGLSAELQAALAAASARRPSPACPSAARPASPLLSATVNAALTARAGPHRPLTDLALSGVAALTGAACRWSPAQQRLRLVTADLLGPAANLTTVEPLLAALADVAPDARLADFDAAAQALPLRVAGGVLGVLYAARAPAGWRDAPGDTVHLAPARNATNPLQPQVDRLQGAVQVFASTLAAPLVDGERWVVAGGGIELGLLRCAAGGPGRALATPSGAHARLPVDWYRSASPQVCAVVEGPVAEGHPPVRPR